MVCLGDLVSLKSPKSRLDIPVYSVGYIIAEGNKVIVYTWKIMGLLPVLSKKGGPTLVKV